MYGKQSDSAALFRHSTKCGVERICGQIGTVTICRSIGPMSGSVITVALRLGLGLGFS